MMIRLTTFLLLFVYPAWLWASNGQHQDDYYSSDIYNAIKEAKIRTHHYDYSSSLRYDRTTSQSIQIPRLLNQEMAKTIIETPDEVPEETPSSSTSSKVETKVSDTPADTRLVQSPNAASFNSQGVTIRAYANPK